MPIPMEKWERMGEDESPCYRDIDDDGEIDDREINPTDEELSD
ncbi:MAG: hypothetical protein WC269_02995 [Candidatus Gracilibacteria bacterium]|jgi:hypothetical protein